MSTDLPTAPRPSPPTRRDLLARSAQGIGGLACLHLLGQDRMVAGVNWGGPLFFGPEDILSYQFSTGFDTDAELQGHTGVWTSYLPWRHYITLVGATVSSPSCGCWTCSRKAPCSSRWPNDVWAANSLSLWIGFQSPDSIENSVRSVSVTVRPGLTNRWPSML